MKNFLRKIFPGKKPVIEADAELPKTSNELAQAVRAYQKEANRKKVKVRSEKYKAVSRRIADPAKYTWNPLLGYPRNHTCICSSGKKFKKCCLPVMERVVSRDAAEFVMKNWDAFLLGRLNTSNVVPKSG